MLPWVGSPQVRERKYRSDRVEQNELDNKRRKKDFTQLNAFARSRMASENYFLIEDFTGH